MKTFVITQVENGWIVSDGSGPNHLVGKQFVAKDPEQLALLVKDLATPKRQDSPEGK